MSARDQAAVVVDARQMEPPEPFVKTMEGLDELKDGEKLLLLLYREPHPLYRTLALNGYTYRASTEPDGTVEILIWKAV
jgi:uncharacterized protein (DUF2249 family)